MLTKNDLQQIQRIVKIEVHHETQKVVKKELEAIKEDVTQIRKDVKTIVNFFDTEYLELRKRVERIEEHLKLPASN
ncbi:hypothetical protein COT62_01805 [Candidatus Roizmanbacteria bacterium CG09_land_8_20_14_0_10_41_9]|uniref:Uncharacterized protein n=1 Tax=Candidatus Roizmanbacteria bacterium CG09_land_8_20_14_0_10_41_9 TaxID=1974850 RepID=A0A2H0WV30_9BACT|nr:MAG: hypothetical protein COT62_01805 [Candidatus Roizmanbacteria bacterium CG09_land_8_20_14_0_10_41_9]